MASAEGLKWYFELTGIRGVCAIASFRLLGHPTKLNVTPPGYQFPVSLRIDTSDFCAYKDVLVSRTKDYGPTPACNLHVVVDAGAHIGMASILFAKMYPNARILAIEPEASNFSSLLRNIAPYSNITPIRAALWKEDGEVLLGPSMAHPKGAFEIQKNGIQRVRAVTMMTLMKEAEIDSIDFLKLDIEGAEKDIFENSSWLSQVRAVGLELHDRIMPGCRAAVERAAAGFRIVERGEVTLLTRENNVGLMASA